MSPSGIQFDMWSIENQFEFIVCASIWSFTFFFSFSLVSFHIHINWIRSEVFFLLSDGADFHVRTHLDNNYYNKIYRCHVTSTSRGHWQAWIRFYRFLPGNEPQPTKIQFKSSIRLFFENMISFSMYYLSHCLPAKIVLWFANLVADELMFELINIAAATTYLFSCIYILYVYNHRKFEIANKKVDYYLAVIFSSMTLINFASNAIAQGIFMHKR